MWAVDSRCFFILLQEPLHQAEPRGLILVLGLWYFVLTLERSRPVFVVCFNLKLNHSLNHCHYFHQVLNQENI